MAKKINDYFRGANYYQTEPSSYTDQYVYGDMIGDNALNFELGKDGDYNGLTIDHSGGGKGCLLGYPLIKEIKHGFKVKTTLGEGGRVVWAAPLFIPAGETNLFFQVNTESVLDHSVQVFEASSGAGPVTPSTATPINSRLLMSKTSLSGHSGFQSTWYGTGANASGKLVWAVIYVEADFNSEALYFSFSVHYNRQKANNDGLMTLVDGSGSEYDVLYTASFEPDGLAVYNQEYEVDEAFVPGSPLDQSINGLILTYMNMQQNGIVEYLTGAPVASNADLTLQSSTDSAPDRSGFYDHSEGGNNGGPIQMPLGGSGVGCFGSGWDNWTQNQPQSMPLGPTAVGPHTNIKLYDHIIYVPDMAIGGATSDAKVTYCLICTQNTSPTCAVTMKARAVNSSGSYSSFETVNIAIGGVGIYWCTSSVRLWRDRFNRLEIYMDADSNFKSAPGAAFVPSISLCGFCVYVQP